LSIGQLGLDVLDPRLNEALLFPSGVVLGIFFQIAVFARLGNRLNDLRALVGLEISQFIAQQFFTTFGQRYPNHVFNSSGRSHRRPADRSLGTRGCH